MSIGIAIIVIGDLVLRTMRGYFLDWASTRIDIKLSARIMEQVVGTRLEFRPNSVGSFASALLNATLIESLVSLETVKAIGIEGAMQHKWEHSASFLTEVGSKLKLLSSSINNGANAI